MVKFFSPFLVKNQNKLICLINNRIFLNEFFIKEQALIESHIYVGLEPTLSLGSRFAFYSFLSPKASKLMLGITFQFFSSYHKTLSVQEFFGIKIIFEYLNPSQINGRINTIKKQGSFFHWLLHLFQFCFLSFLLILKLNYVMEGHP